ncbi:uncharacterized protein LOC121370377 isoform X1 [Gigantopelta aegis]|uniref:uncharacterized protein LOC121370377 isoform X1 n=1 Tax=Gigantopelta aegis TaxID=1735272 RepID=UPI001B88D3BB|nr:uncharacterized protein LOC121370377 isoform X1 [Gigantopelta aegis]
MVISRSSGEVLIPDYFYYKIIRKYSGITVKGECQAADFPQQISTCTAMMAGTINPISFNSMEPEEQQRRCRLNQQGLTCALDAVDDCQDSPQFGHSSTLESMRVAFEHVLEQVIQICTVALSSQQK